jgi:hypothetical protein
LRSISATLYLLLSSAGQVHLIAGGEDQRRLFAHEGRDLGLELFVKLHRAVDQARAGHAGAEAVDGVLGRFTHFGVRGESEVVVRAEHQHALAVDLGLGSVVEVERAEEGVDAHLARVVGGHELVGLLEHVFAADARERGALLHRLVHVGRAGAHVLLLCGVAVGTVAGAVALGRGGALADVLVERRIDVRQLVPVLQHGPGRRQASARVEQAFGRLHHAVVGDPTHHGRAQEGLLTFVDERLAETHGGRFLREKSRNVNRPARELHPSQ